MMYQKPSNIAWMSAVALGMFGCSTIPKDAPQELHDARVALEQAEDADADDVLPETFDLAEQTYDDAVADFKTSLGADDEVVRAESLDDSLASARESKRLSDTMLSLTADLKRWDEDIGRYTALRNAQRDDAVAEQGNADANTTSVVSEVEVAMPVAFFATGSAEIASQNPEAFDHLAAVLKKSADTRINLTGHADYRGGAEFNEELSLRRAEAIANKLVDLGVDRNQITVEARGASQANQSPADPSILQIDRRVEATLTGVAH